MANVFEGKPDGRQSDDEELPVSRFRPKYRALSDTEKALHDQIKDKAADLEALFEQVRDVMGDPVYPGVGGRGMAKQGAGARYLALALTELEVSIMWAVKALTS